MCISIHTIKVVGVEIFPIKIKFTVLPMEVSLASSKFDVTGWKLTKLI